MNRFRQFGRFSVSSLISCLVDMGIFAVLVHFLRGSLPGTYITVSTVAARVVSSVCNFCLNHRVVFGSSEKMRRTALRYFSLAIVQMCCSALAVGALYRLFPVHEVLIKAIVDSLLFLLSFLIQRLFVFPK